jgi:PAS domain S-box-containing protein
MKEDESTRSTALQNVHSILLARDRAEEAVREVAERLQLALEAGQLGDWRWNAADDMVALSERAATLFGLAANVGSITWAQMRGMLHEEHRERARVAVEQALETRTDYDIEYRVRKPSGEDCWIAARGRGTYTSDGAVLGMIGVVQDITARRTIEDELRAREEELRASFEQAAIGIAIAALDGRFVQVNRKLADILGYGAGELEQRSYHEITHPDDTRRSTTLLNLLRSGELQDFSLEQRYMQKDGVPIFCLTTVTRTRATPTHPSRFIAIVEDISRRRQAEDALREETRVLDLLNKTGTLLASQLDLRGLLQLVTDAGTELSGAKFGAFFYNSEDQGVPAYQLFTLSGAPREAFERFGHPRAMGLFGPTFRGEGVIRSDDVMKDPRYGTVAPHFGLPKGHLPVRSYLAVPVIARSGEVLGALLFGHPEPAVFTQRSERIITGIAAQAAVAIDNARLYERAQGDAEERKHLLESERSARAHAERMSAIKDEFLAVLSHELRTPLSAILGWAQIMRHRIAHNDDMAKGLEIIERNARVQTQLIEDLLDMSRISSGKMRLDLQTLAPQLVIEAAAEMLRPAAAAKGIQLELKLDHGVGYVSADPSRLQQVVSNILSNAIKFTPKSGRVEVYLRRVGTQLEISVKDTGIGIRADFLEQVFERFQQADASSTRKHGGLGLGLAIVRHLVELHGGSVRAASPGEGLGTTFTVELPARAKSGSDEPGRPHPSTPPPPQTFKTKDLTGVRVLVVDDEPDARSLVARILAECGADVASAGSALEALSVLDEREVDVLVSDIGMPSIDGYELLRRMRALPSGRGAKLPAIALTAFARSEDRAQALAAGFLVHLSKPVEAGELVATVAGALNRG